MATEIRMPRLDADMEEADLLSWLVEPGETVVAGDLLLELETDKSTVEFESPVSGTLVEIRVPAGTPGVKVDTVLGVIEELASDGVDPEPVEPPAATNEARTTPDEVVATALARRLADQAGLELEDLEGTGARGRITKRDVERQVQAGEAVAHVAAQTAEGGVGGAEATLESDAGTRLIPHSRMRRTIATRLSAAKQTIPHFYLLADCAADALAEARASLNADGRSPKISVNDLVIRAAALALREVPEANASWTDEAIVRHERVDIAVAVATEAGLITPILRDADRKGLEALSNEMRDLAERARAGKLSPREYQGGGFSISNLGMYGIDSVYPIINPPHACILGVGAARAVPIVRDGAVAAGSMMSLTLSADHRVVDGAVGARLLAAIKQRIEQPLDMLL